MNFIYLDCFSGISGDMFLAALLELGFPFEQLEECLALLDLDAYVSSEEITVQGIKARRISVQDHAPRFRNLKDIQVLIERSPLPAEVARDALMVLSSIAEAEATIHGIPVEKVHFHEIGAADTIVDVVGVLSGLRFLDVDVIHCAPLPWSNGFINMSHGKYPSPSPAAALLMQGLPCRGSSANIELVTPTGAALVKFLNPVFGPFPESTPLSVAYGAGTAIRNDSVPNLLRLIKGSLGSPIQCNEDRVAVLETEIDDMSPEQSAYLFEILLADPMVLDVFTMPAQMKKNRAGLLLSVLTRPEAISHTITLIMTNSTTLGIRYSIQSRWIAPRKEVSLSTPLGPVRIKYALLPDGSQRFKPEFDDCRSLARINNLSFSRVLEMVNQLAVKLLPIPFD